MEGEQLRLFVACWFISRKVKVGVCCYGSVCGMEDNKIEQQLRISHQNQ